MYFVIIKYSIFRILFLSRRGTKFACTRRAHRGILRIRFGARGGKCLVILQHEHLGCCAAGGRWNYLPSDRFSPSAELDHRSARTMRNENANKARQTPLLSARRFSDVFGSHFSLLTMLSHRICFHFRNFYHIFRWTLFPCPPVTLLHIIILLIRKRETQRDVSEECALSDGRKRKIQYSSYYTRSSVPIICFFLRCAPLSDISAFSINHWTESDAKIEPI